MKSGGGVPDTTMAEAAVAMIVIRERALGSMFAKFQREYVRSNPKTKLGTNEWSHSVFNSDKVKKQVFAYAKRVTLDGTTFTVQACRNAFYQSYAIKLFSARGKELVKVKATTARGNLLGGHEKTDELRLLKRALREVLGEPLLVYATQPPDQFLGVETEPKPCKEVESGILACLGSDYLLALEIAGFIERP